MHNLDYSNCESSEEDIIRWIVFLRCFCYIRAPMCIYTQIRIPSNHRVFAHWEVISTPEFVSNILADIFSARARRPRVGVEPVKDEYAFLGGLDEEDIRYIKITERFKPRWAWGGGRTRGAFDVGVGWPVRFDDITLKACVAAHGAMREDVLKREIMRYYVSVSRRDDVQPAGLTDDEYRWLYGRRNFGVVEAVRRAR